MALTDSWKRDPLEYARMALTGLAPPFTQKKGMARTGDAVEEAKGLRESDLAIVDPPYSAAQYSRFYHVLETIARNANFSG